MCLNHAPLVCHYLIGVYAYYSPSESARPSGARAASRAPALSVVPEFGPTAGVEAAATSATAAISLYPAGAATSTAAGLHQA